MKNNRYDDYEDEIDRMRARSSRRKSGRTYNSRDVARKPERTVHKSRHRKKKKPVLLLLVLALLVFAGTYLYRGLRSTGYWTVAVFGVDSRDGKLGKGALSDVEMLCSINRKTGEIRIVSVFRDSYLRIDQKEEYNKINQAYALGGHKQAVAALEDNLDLAIDDYATFNWKAVVDAINVLGGVDLEITDKEFDYINSFITETVESTGVGSYHLEHSGMNHLDGVQAVAYARLRLMDTDFNRTQRQRKVLGLAMEKAKAADSATLKALVAVVFPQVSTSIGMDDLLGMAKNAKKYYIGQTSGFPFAHAEAMVGKKDCVIPATLESNVVQLHGFLYDDTQYQVSGKVREISRHIADVSGVGEPGKDTESGKNVGAQGSGSGSAAQQPPAQTEAQPQPTEAASAEDATESFTETPSESSQEPDPSQDQNPEGDGLDSGDTDGTVEETTAEEEEPAGPGSHPSGGQGSGNQPSDGQCSGNQPSGGQGSSSQPPSGGQGPGNQPSGGQDSNSQPGDRQPVGSLEAPGQNTESPSQSGPGSPGTPQGSGLDSGNGAVAGPGM